MSIIGKIKKLGTRISRNAVAAYQDFSSAFEDTTRMCDAENRIYSVSSGAFCRAFGDVAKRISYTRATKIADTYCSLAEEAIEMLVSGISESDVLCHFEKMLIRERSVSE